MSNLIHVEHILDDDSIEPFEFYHQARSAGAIAQHEFVGRDYGIHVDRLSAIRVFFEDPHAAMLFKLAYGGAQ